MTETGQILDSDREPGPFGDSSYRCQEALGRPAGEALVQGTPLRLLKALAGGHSHHSAAMLTKRTH